MSTYKKLVWIGIIFWVFTVFSIRKSVEIAYQSGIICGINVVEESLANDHF